MDCPLVSYRSKIPIVFAPFGYRQRVLFTGNCLIDASSEIDKLFVGPFQSEAQIVRLIAVSALPSSFTRIGLNKIGQRYAKLNISLAQSSWLVVRPRQVTQIHMLSLRTSAVLAEGAQALLRHNRRIVQGTQDGPFEVGHTIAVTT
jgi:hypothetical protein